MATPLTTRYSLSREITERNFDAARQLCGHKPELKLLSANFQEPASKDPPSGIPRDDF